MARASKKRKLEDRVESSLEEVLYFRFRGEVVSTRVLHEKGCVIIMDTRYIDMDL